MKKISQADLIKMVREKKLSFTRNGASINPEKTEKFDQPLAVIVGEIVISMAESLTVSADKMANSNIMVAQIAKTIQDDLKEKPREIVGAPKKRKWKFTPHRDYNNFIESITVEEI